MTFKILIVEDQELYAEQLEMLIEKLDYEHMGTVDNSTEALSIILGDLPDLILMDIHIQGSHDGIELADIIHKSHPIPIIFITSLQDDATFARANKTNPVNFLVKPFNDIQLQRIIETTTKNLAQQPALLNLENPKEEWENDFLFQEHFYIKTRQKLEKVAVESVLFLASDGHHSWVHTEEKKFLVRISMKELLRRLPSELFMQTHRSYVVNFKKVQSVDLEESTVTVGNKQVALSKRNREELLKKLNWI